MKSATRILLLLTTAVLAMGASAAPLTKKVDKAKSLSGNTDKLADARILIGEALADSLTALDSYTWYVAGKIEHDAYNIWRKRLMVNPSSNVDKKELGNQLAQTFKYWEKALALDTVPDAKGRVKPRYSKEIRKNLSALQSDYFSMGNYFYGEKQYYPDEYRMYISYAQLPDKGVAVTDSLLPKASLNAALAAYNAQQYAEAIEALKLTRRHGDIRPQTFYYEIAAWRGQAQKGETTDEKARENIADLSLEGFRLFGMQEPFFLRNYVNMELLDDKVDEAIEVLLEALKSNSGNSEVLSLLGRVLDRAGDSEMAEYYYREAAKSDQADYETLKNAARIIFTNGNAIWKSLEGTSPEVQAKRDEIIANYFKVANELATRAAAMNSDDIELKTLLENINYVLLTGF